jgi:hypothetical protein
LAVVTVKIALNIAALITKVERRLVKEPSIRIISVDRQWHVTVRTGEAMPGADTK